jgi:preprotein translocase subunit SecG
MVQNPKGGGLSSSFGGGSQQVGGVQKTSDFLDRSTWILASLLLVLILISNATLTPSIKSQDSKLLQDGASEQNIPDAIPEIQEVMPVQIPEEPSLENN